MTTDEVKKLLEEAEHGPRGQFDRSLHPWPFTPALCAQLCRELLTKERACVELGGQADRAEERAEAAERDYKASIAVNAELREQLKAAERRVAQLEPKP